MVGWLFRHDQRGDSLHYRESVYRRQTGEGEIISRQEKNFKFEGHSGTTVTLSNSVAPADHNKMLKVFFECSNLMRPFEFTIYFKLKKVNPTYKSISPAAQNSLTGG